MTARITGSGNRIATTSVVANLSLFALYDQLVFARLFENSYQGEFMAKPGDTIQIKREYRAQVQDGNVLADANALPLVDRLVDFVIDSQHNFHFNLQNKDLTLAIRNFNDRYFSVAMEEMAQKYDYAGGEAIGLGLHHVDGTPGTAMTVKNAHSVRTHAQWLAIPENGYNRAVLNPGDYEAVSENIIEMNNAPADEMTSAIRERFKGKLVTWPCYDSVHLPFLVVADNGASVPLVDSADGYVGNMLPTNGWANSTRVLNKGQLIKIANVEEIQPLGERRSFGRDATFTVLEDVTSSAAGAAVIPISPEINDGTLQFVDGAGNNFSAAAFKNVSMKAADDAAITLVGDEGKSYFQSVFFESRAATYVNAVLEKARTAVIDERATDDQTGLSIAISGAYNINNRSETLRGDCLYGVQTIDPRMGIRFISEEV